MAFYQIIIDEGKRKKYAYGVLLGEYPVETINCQICGQVWHKDNLPLSYKSKIALSNDNFPDFLGVLTFTAVSEKVKNMLLESKISGYKLHEVDVVKTIDISEKISNSLKEKGFNVDKFSNFVQDYFYFDVSIGAELHFKSEIILKYNCNECGFRQYVTAGKTYIDPFHEIFIKQDTWNGNSIFRVNELGQQLFCTEVFVNQCKRYKLTGVDFKKINNR